MAIEHAGKINEFNKKKDELAKLYV